MASLLQDLRFALRLWRKAPGFATIAIVALALGIGANTAIFSVVQAVLLRPLPYPQADRIVMVARDFSGNYGLSASIPDYLDWRAQTNVFQDLAAFDPLPSGFNLAGQGLPLRLAGLHVTANFFSVLAVQPAIGRGFTPDEDQPGQAPVAILSYRAWRDHFGGDPAAVGRAITLNDQSYTVIGVLPRTFRFSPDVDVYVPLDYRTAVGAHDRGVHIPEVIGRLRAGAALPAAQAQMSALAKRLDREYPNDEGNAGIALIPLRRQLSGDMRPALLILFGAVGLVLLIACANVANLLLARAAVRQKEIALRVALGAGRGRIVRQMLAESVLLALAGAALGLLLARWGVRVLLALSPPGLPQVNAIGVNGWVLLFTLGIALVTGVIFGLAPALEASRAHLNDVLKEGSIRSGTGPRQRRLRGALVITEVAFAVVLLIGAGLLIGSFARLRDVNPGFNPDHALEMQVALSAGRYSTTPPVANFFRQVLPRIQGLPGVVAAAATSDVPLGPCPDFLFAIVGRPAPRANDSPDAFYHAVTPGFVAALGLHLLRGRAFTDADDAHSQPVVIINQAAVRTWWPKQNPVGQAIWIGRGRPQFAEPAPRMIVGVVNDVKQQNLENREREPAMYLPLPQVPSDVTATLVRLLPPHLLIRTAGDPLALAGAVERQVRAVDSQQPLFNVTSLRQQIYASLAPQQFNMLLLGIFAALALVLAGVGIYGVISYSVTQRHQEIGIRMALGADRPTILRLVVGEGLRLALLGVAAGLAGAFLLTRLMASLLFGVRASDPVTFALTAAVLAAIAVFASYWPARRAAALSPLRALRHE